MLVAEGEQKNRKLRRSDTVVPLLRSFRNGRGPIATNISLLAELSPRKLNSLCKNYFLISTTGTCSAAWTRPKKSRIEPYLSAGTV